VFVLLLAPPARSFLRRESLAQCLDMEQWTRASGFHSLYEGPSLGRAYKELMPEACAPSPLQGSSRPHARAGGS